jgi:hypothetical protein
MRRGGISRQTGGGRGRGSWGPPGDVGIHACAHSARAMVHRQVGPGCGNVLRGPYRLQLRHDAVEATLDKVGHALDVHPEHCKGASGQLGPRGAETDNTGGALASSRLPATGYVNCTTLLAGMVHVQCAVAAGLGAGRWGLAALNGTGSRRRQAFANRGNVLSSSSARPPGRAPISGRDRSATFSIMDLHRMATWRR